MDQIVLGSQVSFGCLDRCVPQKQLDLLKLATRGPAQLRACAMTVVRCDPRQTSGFCIGLEKLPDDLLAHGGGPHLIAPVDCSELLDPRNDGADVHASIATLTQVGTGTVRTRPCFPTRSTTHQRLSRC